MKQEINNAGGMRTMVRLDPLTNPQHQGWYNFEMSTVYDNADQVREQVNFRMCLDPAAFQRFKAIVNEV